MDYYHPTTPPPPKRDHTLRNVLFAGFGCLFLVALVAGMFLFRFFNSSNGPSRAVQQHLNRINEGNITAAYDCFTRQYRSEHTIDEFRNNLSLFSSQLPSRRSHFTHVEVTNTSANVGGTLTGRDGALFPVYYRLLLVDGQWKIEDFRWESPGEQQRVGAQVLSTEC